MALVTVALPAPVRAQGPLSVEQLIVDDAQWQFTAASRFATAPGPAGEYREAGSSVSLRYGVRRDVELNIGLNRARILGISGTGPAPAATCDLDLGLTWQVRHEDRWPALVLEGRIPLLADGNARQFLPGGYGIAATLYKSIDPLVLSLTAAHRAGPRRTASDSAITPGATWRLEPTINFAVNPAVTLFGGATLSRREGTRAGGARLSDPIHGVGLRGGVAWALGIRSTLFLSAEMASRSGLGAVNLQWMYAF